MQPSQAIPLLRTRKQAGARVGGFPPLAQASGGSSEPRRLGFCQTSLRAWVNLCPEPQFLPEEMEEMSPPQRERERIREGAALEGPRKGRALPQSRVSGPCVEQPPHQPPHQPLSVSTPSFHGRNPTHSPSVAVALGVDEHGLGSNASAFIS